MNRSIKHLLIFLRYNWRMCISRGFNVSALQRGFSLIELSVVVAIISVVAVLGLEVAANFVVRSATETSRERLKVVDDAVANFFRVYGRLPCPALKTTPPETPTYGTEDCATPLPNTTPGFPGDGLLAGAVPFRALNLPMSFSLDGFNSKLNYVVTKNLTLAGGSATINGRLGSTGGTPATNGTAGIEVRTGVLNNTCATSCQKLADPASVPAPSGAAYLIFSSGADKRGAVSGRGTTLNACTTTVNNSDARVDSQNCVFGSDTIRGYMTQSTIPYNVFYDNRYNAGFNRSSYFDDVVVWRSKAQL